MPINKNKASIYIKKSLLQNILVEEIIIGHILSNKSFKNKIINSINSYFFSLKKYQMLFNHIKKIQEKEETLNIIEIIRTLWEKEQLNELGGITNIINIIQKSQNLQISYDEYTHLKYLINILHYYYLKRLFLQYSNTMIYINYFYDISITKIYDKSIQYLNIISNTYKKDSTYKISKDINSFLYRMSQHSQEKNIIFSGFKDLDKIIKGFRYGDLVIIAGRPSMGKTSFAINIIYHLSIKLKIAIHLFSLEMSKEEILHKLLALISSINSQTIESKLIQTKDWSNIQKACRILLNSPISIDDNGNPSINYIKLQCQDYHIKKRVLVIDYLQLIKIENKHIESRSQELGNITRELKLLVKKIKSIAIVLSQLNRNIENRINKRPLLSDLRESGCIDCLNIPTIQKNKKTFSVKIIHCLKEHYILNDTNHFILHTNSKQYLFGIINFTNTFLFTTHNHKIYTYNKWYKEDHLKYSHFHIIKQKNILNRKLTTELCKLFFIKRLYKKPVYDIALYKYHNFIINDYIIHNSIEQDADLILMLYKNEENTDRRIIDIVIAKHRHGPVGNFQLLFHADICKFSHIQNNELLS